jgi:hypothetical protein
MERMYIVTLVCAMIMCANIDVFERIRNDTYDQIFRGTYQGSALYVRDGGAFASLISDFRHRIETNDDVLPHIVHTVFSTSEQLDFRYKFTAHDADTEYLVLRYFARIPEHDLFAGYQIQFVFEIPTEKLIRIYTAEVPLE